MPYLSPQTLTSEEQKLILRVDFSRKTALVE